MRRLLSIVALCAAVAHGQDPKDESDPKVRWSLEFLNTAVRSGQITAGDLRAVYVLGNGGNNEAERSHRNDRRGFLNGDFIPELTKVFQSLPYEPADLKAAPKELRPGDLVVWFLPTWRFGAVSVIRSYKHAQDVGQAVTYFESSDVAIEESDFCLSHAALDAPVRRTREVLCLRPTGQPLPAGLRAGARKPGTRYLTNSIGMRFARVPAGRFWMGSNRHAKRGEGPLHEVELTRPYLMGAFETTQKEYERVMGPNPSRFVSGSGGSPDHPVERVTWAQAVEFCEKLSALPEERNAGRTYRLPSEAEWECAAARAAAYRLDPGARYDVVERDGRTVHTAADFHVGTTLGLRQANVSGAGGAPGRTTPVGAYAANRFGLHDMHGNVAEWCQDTWSRDYGDRAGKLTVDPLLTAPNPKDAGLHVHRGGSWSTNADAARATARTFEPLAKESIGFRVVCVAAGGPSGDGTRDRLLDYESMLGRMQAAFDEGRDQDVLKLGREALRADTPSREGALRLVGLAHFRARQFAEAADHLLQAHEAAPRDMDLLLDCLEALTCAGQTTRARAIADHAERGGRFMADRDAAILGYLHIACLILDGEYETSRGGFRARLEALVKHRRAVGGDALAWDGSGMDHFVKTRVADAQKRRLMETLCSMFQGRSQGADFLATMDKLLQD